MVEGVEKKKRRALRKPRIQHENVDYSLMNRTELVQLAQFNEIPGANHGTPREVLIHALKNMEPIGVNPIDKKRDKLKAFLERYWKRVHMQLPYPVTRCPNCYLSSDVQVAMCYIPNKREGHLS